MILNHDVLYEYRVIYLHELFNDTYPKSGCAQCVTEAETESQTSSYTICGWFKKISVQFLKVKFVTRSILWREKEKVVGY